MALGRRIAVLMGGVGGAKLASGLMQAADPRRLSFIVNTGDDFWHLGLRICPDLDTAMYTLAGNVDPAAGWGLQGDTTVTLESLGALYNVDTWFRLGDKDLATHLLRTDWLRQGQSLTAVTAELARRLQIESALLPMCDAEAGTLIDTVSDGRLGFQEYFVQRRWQPALRAIHYQGCGAALSPQARDALERADIVLIAPSNPWLSIHPILALPGARATLKSLTAPVVAVTPIIAGEAVKGPTAKIMRELGLQVSAGAIARQYEGLIDGFVDDIRNDRLARPGLRLTRLNTLMKDARDKKALAENILAWIEGWAA